MSNQLMSHWLLSIINDFTHWGLIKDKKVCGILITHWCHWLVIDVIDQSLITYWLLAWLIIFHYPAQLLQISHPLVPVFLRNTVCRMKMVFLCEKWHSYSYKSLFYGWILEGLRWNCRQRRTVKQENSVIKAGELSHLRRKGHLTELNQLDTRGVNVWFNSKHQRGGTVTSATADDNTNNVILNWIA